MRAVFPHVPADDLDHLRRKLEVNRLAILGVSLGDDEVDPLATRNQILAHVDLGKIADPEGNLTPEGLRLPLPFELRPPCALSRADPSQPRAGSAGADRKRKSATVCGSSNGRSRASILAVSLPRPVDRGEATFCICSKVRSSALAQCLATPLRKAAIWAIWGDV